ncbi:MAG: hypothetical protein JWO52_5919, partial [Gammaproteobacteria bacterium]|nr:hypothetical protein [Gammaproteobacteria bacterium]
MCMPRVKQAMHLPNRGERVTL